MQRGRLSACLLLTLYCLRCDIWTRTNKQISRFAWIASIVTTRDKLDNPRHIKHRWMLKRRTFSRTVHEALNSATKSAIDVAGSMDRET